MPHDLKDDLIQSRVDQLKAITSRRNVLLREMYHLMRHRNSIGSILDITDDEDDTDCDKFLLKLDLDEHGENAFIANHIGTSFEPFGHKKYATVQSPNSAVSLNGGQTSSPENEDISREQKTRIDAHDGEDTDDELDLLTTSTDDVEKAAQYPPKMQDEQAESAVTPYDHHDSRTDIVPKDGHGDIIMSEVNEKQPAEVEELTPQESRTIQQTISRETEPASTESVVTTVNPRAIYKPSVSSSIFLSTPRNSIVIPVPSEPAISLDQYNVEQPPEPEQIQQSSGAELRYSLKAEYTLPPLHKLPPEFTRKKSTKRRKDRDRPEKSQKDDSLPIGINRWAAMLAANPLYKRVSRSTKCLSTKDWSIAIAELRLIRTAERIETLKNQARWGLRQVKKQRGIGGLLKTHWDYLMDEMKWMRIDFREERKWKLALAYHLSTAVLEWHSVSSWEERMDKGICVKWKRQPESRSIIQERYSRDMDVDSPNEDEIESGLLPSKSLLGLDYGSDNEDAESDDKTTDVVNPLETTAIINDALDGADEMRQQASQQTTADQSPETLHLKTEDLDESAILQASVPEALDGQSVTVQNSGLKTDSNDPLLGSKSSSLSLNGDNEDKPSKAKSSAYAPLREKLVYSSADKLFIGPEDLEFAQNQNEDRMDQDPFQPLDLSVIFPDLQPFAMLDVAPSVTEIKKKSSRGERDDPNKRIEETNYTKVYPVGQYMFTKPTLLGPLQPSKRWKDGKWLPIEDVPITPESEANGYIKALEESVSDLFDLKVKPSGPTLPPQARDARRVKVDQYWSPNDDLLLKSLVDKYPGNWNLIAECFNGCRKTTPADRRTASECMDRWKTKWGMDLLTKDNPHINSEEQTPPIGVQASSSQLSDFPMSNSTNSVATGPSVTTRGVKRLASTSVSSQVSPSLSAGSEPKKRRRHLLLQESIRKTARKRQEQQQKLLTNQRKTPGMHETHLQFTKLPKCTPAELSRLKAEKDANIMLEHQKARARQEELKNQQQKLNGIPIPKQPGQQTPVQHPPGGQPPLSQQQVQQLQLLQQQAVQAAQAQASQANRSGNITAGNARPGNVNIARLSTPTAVGVAGAPRLSGQQMLQLQQQAQQRLAVGGVAQQTSLNGAAGIVNGTAGQTVNGQGVSQFASRDATASPASHGLNSPHLTAGGGGGASNPPRSPHDQAAASQQAINQANLVAASSSVAVNGSRSGNPFLFGANGANLASANYNTEQLNALRIHMLSQLTQHQQQGAGPAVPQVPAPQG